MSDDTLSLRASELRRVFDESFTLPRREAQEERVKLLAVRVAGCDYAIEFSEVSGLLRAPKVVAVPGPRRELLGIAGVRGRVVPVYSLALLLGHTAGGDVPRWLVLCGPAPGVGFAAGGAGTLVEVLRANIYGAPDAAAGTFVSRTARVGGAMRGVIDMQAVIQEVAGGFHEVRTTREL